MTMPAPGSTQAHQGTKRPGRQAPRKPQNVPGNAPPSIRMFWPVMNPAFALARKAQSAPNSAGSPRRWAGLRVCARAVSSGTPALGGDALQRGPPAVGFERSRLDGIDGHVVARVSTRGRRQERSEARARARRNVEPGDRRAHGARGDVDDAAELALRHPRQQRLDERDRRQHIGFHAGLNVVARDRVESLKGRAAVVVDEDVGLRAGGDQRPTRR